jgi:hypothetical protein
LHGTAGLLTISTRLVRPSVNSGHRQACWRRYGAAAKMLGAAPGSASSAIGLCRWVRRPRRRQLTRPSEVIDHGALRAGCAASAQHKIGGAQLADELAGRLAYSLPGAVVVPARHARWLASLLTAAAAASGSARRWLCQLAAVVKPGRRSVACGGYFVDRMFIE